MPRKASDAHILVVGSGPAGLEATHQLGKRGYRVTLAEARGELGGRVARESRLPGLAAWARVRDYRLGQIREMAHVETYLESELTAAQVLEFGADHVCLATGATWRHDGVGRANRSAIAGMSRQSVLTPDDIMDGKRPPAGPVVIFDDDHYYLGGVIAELLSAEGHAVTIVTPETVVADWTRYTLEQGHIEHRLKQAGITILPRRNVVRVSAGEVTVLDTLTDGEETLPGSLVAITMRLPNDVLYTDSDDAGRRSAEGGDQIDPPHRRLLRPFPHRLGHLRRPSLCTGNGRRCGYRCRPVQTRASQAGTGVTEVLSNQEPSDTWPSRADASDAGLRIYVCCRTNPPAPVPPPRFQRWVDPD